VFRNGQALHSINANIIFILDRHGFGTFVYNHEICITNFLECTPRIGQTRVHSKIIMGERG